MLLLSGSQKAAAPFPLKTDAYHPLKQLRSWILRLPGMADVSILPRLINSHAGQVSPFTHPLDVSA
jgi:hypothetical protein